MILFPAAGLASLGRGRTSGIPNSGPCLESGIQARAPGHLIQGDSQESELGGVYGRAWAGYWSSPWLICVNNPLMAGLSYSVLFPEKQ